jgi:hypothetical protein
MKTRLTVIFLAIAISIGGLSNVAGAGDCIGPKSQWKSLKITLFDTQMMSGGRNIYISGKGKAVVTEISWNRKPREYRYAFDLTFKEIAEIAKTLVKNDYCKLSNSVRPGIPDEAVASMAVVD